MWPIESQPGVEPMRRGLEGLGGGMSSARIIASSIRCSIVVFGIVAMEYVLTPGAFITERRRIFVEVLKVDTNTDKHRHRSLHAQPQGIRQYREAESYGPDPYTFAISRNCKRAARAVFPTRPSRHWLRATSPPR